MVVGRVLSLEHEDSIDIRFVLLFDNIDDVVVSIVFTSPYSLVYIPQPKRYSKFLNRVSV